MKIIEILDEGLGSAIGGAIKGVAKGANAFVSGASDGKIDAANLKKYLNLVKTPKGTTRSINANLPPQDQFDRVLTSIYGNAGKSDKVRQDWADAINSGDKNKVRTLGQRPEYRDARREEVLDGDNLKPSTTTVVDDLLRMAQQGYVFEVNPKKEEPAKDEENPDEKL